MPHLQDMIVEEREDNGVKYVELVATYRGIRGFIGIEDQKEQLIELGYLFLGDAWFSQLRVITLPPSEKWGRAMPGERGTTIRAYPRDAEALADWARARRFARAGGRGRVPNDA